MARPNPPGYGIPLARTAAAREWTRRCHQKDDEERRKFYEMYNTNRQQREGLGEVDTVGDILDLVYAGPPYHPPQQASRVNESFVIKTSATERDFQANRTFQKSAVRSQPLLVMEDGDTEDEGYQSPRFREIVKHSPLQAFVIVPAKTPGLRLVPIIVNSTLSIQKPSSYACVTPTRPPYPGVFANETLLPAQGPLFDPGQPFTPYPTLESDRNLLRNLTLSIQNRTWANLENATRVNLEPTRPTESILPSIETDLRPQTPDVKYISNLTKDNSLDKNWKPHTSKGSEAGKVRAQSPRVLPFSRPKTIEELEASAILREQQVVPSDGDDSEMSLEVFHNGEWRKRAESSSPEFPVERQAKKVILYHPRDRRPHSPRGVDYRDGTHYVPLGRGFRDRLRSPYRAPVNCQRSRSPPRERERHERSRSPRRLRRRQISPQPSRLVHKRQGRSYSPPHTRDRPLRPISVARRGQPKPQHPSQVQVQQANPQRPNSVQQTINKPGALQVDCSEGATIFEHGVSARFITERETSKRPQMLILRVIVLQKTLRFLLTHPGRQARIPIFDILADDIWKSDEKTEGGAIEYFATVYRDKKSNKWRGVDMEDETWVFTVEGKPAAEEFEMIYDRALAKWC